MRLLWLAKRTLMAQDIVASRFGRYFHLPRELARLGHDVTLCLLSYRFSKAITLREGRLTVVAAPLGPVYVRAMKKALSDADAVVGSSDSPYVVLAALLSAAKQVPFVADLHDNFDAYSSRYLPGMSRAREAALGRASLITCVSPALQSRMMELHPDARVERLENGIDPGLGWRRDRASCRARWGVATAVPLFGYAGALASTRDLSTIFEAWPRVRRALPEARLLLAGKRELTLPSLDGMTYLGQLPHSEVPELLGALDVALVPTRRGAFGDYCFPFKLNEALAAGVPPLVADFGAAAEWLEGFPRHRYLTGSSEDLARAMIELWVRPEVPTVPVPSWAELASRLERWLGAP